MAPLAALALFVSAFLLFSVQPLVGRMLLPLLGGSPAVWNTCLVFFQAALLAGYLYAHLLASKISSRYHIWVHFCVLVLPALALPVAVRSAVPAGQDDYPVGWLAWLLLTTAGLPFFVVATTGPLVQRWFADAGGRDPYVLYAASNAGSLLGLLAYPFVIEPNLTLAEQGTWWAVGYGVFAALVVLCGVWFSWRAGGVSPLSLTDVKQTQGADAPRSPWRIIALAFVPSSWLVGVTAFLSTDLAAIPLLWVVPLALYLFTFIVAFSSIRLPLQLLSTLAAVASLVLVLALLIGATEPLTLVTGVHLTAFFLTALFCHATLAAERPPPEHLTAFYLRLSAGGVLGGLFNALVAPVLFARLGLIEYPLMAVLVGLFRPRLPKYPPDVRRDVAWLLALAALAFSLVSVTRTSAVEARLRELAESSGFPFEVMLSAARFALPCIVAYTFVDHPRRFVAGLAVLLLVGATAPGASGETVRVERNFLGVLRVTKSPDGRFIRLVHGNTVHGQQSVAPRSDTPLTYYHPTGPAGDVFRLLDDGPKSIALVGLGTGSLAHYAKPGEGWTFYELDPAVERIARDPRYFTYLEGRDVRVVTGDARLRLADAPDHAHKLVVLDAFSSDAIPVHLLTAEALELYRRKLTPDGLIAFHVSNRYLDLAPILGKLAAAADPPMRALVFDDLFVTDAQRDAGKYPSRWVVLANREEDLRPLRKGIRWSPITVPPDTPRWTDDFSNLLSAFRRSEWED